MVFHHKAIRFCRVVCAMQPDFIASLQRPGSPPSIRSIHPSGASSPAPLLLLHGTNLVGANVTGAPIQRTITSPNGRWIIVWPDTHITRPMSLHLAVTTSTGAAAVEYRFQPRHSATEGIAGFFPAHVIVCLMPDRFADGDLTNDNSHGFPG